MSGGSILPLEAQGSQSIPPQVSLAAMPGGRTPVGSTFLLRGEGSRPLGRLHFNRHMMMTMAGARALSARRLADPGETRGSQTCACEKIVSIKKQLLSEEMALGEMNEMSEMWS